MFNYQRAMEITKRRQKYFNYPKTNNTFICQNSADDSLMMVKFNNFPQTQFLSAWPLRICQDQIRLALT